MKQLVVGSLFSGIGGFEMAAERLGMRVAWSCEIDPFARRVLAARFPGVTVYDDVRTIDPGVVEPIDVLTFGFPCQDLSVAGKRAGLGGERSGLFWEAVRVALALRPRWLVAENVPGLLSSEGGRDIQTILDAFEDANYVVDLDVLDAQYFGVAQRRRRVFFVCQDRDSLLQKKTTSSALTISQCLIEILQLSLEGLSFPYAIESEISDSLSSARSVDGLRRRMKLFGLTEAGCSETLLRCLEEGPAKFPSDQRSSGLRLGGALPGFTRLPETVTSSSEWSGETATLREFWSTGPSWSSILAVLSETGKWCITSTGTSATTELRTFTCAIALLLIASRICQLKDCSPTFWSAASSALTALRAYTNYARSASSDLFTPMEWLQPWRDFLGQAERLRDAIERAGIERFPALLVEPDGSFRHPAPRREAGKDLAPTLDVRAGRSGETSFHTSGGLAVSPSRGAKANDPHRADMAAHVEVSPTLRAGGNSTGGHRPPGSDVDTIESLVVAHTLRGEGFDASEDGTGRGTPLVVAAHETGPGWWNEAPITGTLRREGEDRPSRPSNVVAFDWQKGNDKHNVRPSTMNVVNEQSLTLGTTRTPAVAFSVRGRDGGAQAECAVDGVTNTLRTPEGGSSHQFVAYGIGSHASAAGADVSNRSHASGGPTGMGINEEQANTLRAGRTGEVGPASSVRRLSPTECERLQAFSSRDPLTGEWSDGHTCLCGRNKGRSVAPAGEEPCKCPDGPRYRALGNAIAVSVGEWTLRKIVEAEEALTAAATP